MAATKKHIDIDDLPALVALAGQVRSTKVPHTLRLGGKDLAVLVPAPDDGTRLNDKEAFESFLSAAGGWSDVDTDRLIADIRERRAQSSRPPIDL
jgi:hypothetical protein